MLHFTVALLQLIALLLQLVVAFLQLIFQNVLIIRPEYNLSETWQGGSEFAVIVDQRYGRFSDHRCGFVVARRCGTVDDFYSFYRDITC